MFVIFGGFVNFFLSSTFYFSRPNRQNLALSSLKTKPKQFYMENTVFCCLKVCAQLCIDTWGDYKELSKELDYT